MELSCVQVVTLPMPIPDERDPPLDIVYLFRHSKHHDEEIRYSLRSVAQNLPFIRKVWIFGDRPAFLTDDRSMVEHVPHEYMAPLLGYKTPVRSDFLMLLLASLIPGLTFDFVRFSDDYIVLKGLERSELCRVRVQEDLNKVKNRGKGKFKQMLWRTYDILKRYGYAGYNFDDHLPMPYTKQTVFEAFMAFREFLTEDRYVGMLSALTICNYAAKHHNLKYVWPEEERARAGFYFKSPSSMAEIEEKCKGKLFLSFDDDGYGPPMAEYVHQLFPNPCRYERL